MDFNLTIVLIFGLKNEYEGMKNNTFEADLNYEKENTKFKCF